MLLLIVTISTILIWIFFVNKSASLYIKKTGIHCEYRFRAFYQLTPDSNITMFSISMVISL
jgi:hypothetical protein